MNLSAECLRIRASTADSEDGYRPAGQRSLELIESSAKNYWQAVPVSKRVLVVSSMRPERVVTDGVLPVRWPSKAGADEVSPALEGQRTKMVRQNKPLVTLIESNALINDGTR